jgi:cell division protein FtsI/penicillin-binding protein 2
MTLAEKIEQISKQVKNNGFVVFSLVIFWGFTTVLAARLAYLQISPESEIVITEYITKTDKRKRILKGEEKKNYIQNISNKKIVEAARRGRILDRNGKEIAYSIPDEIQNSQWQRVYTYTKSAPLVGYVKRDFFQNGIAGIEKAFDSYLKGEDGYSELRRHANGNTAPKLGKMKQRVKDGSDVHLTIDLEIQKIVDDVLEETVNNSKAKGGMAIIMNPYTGEIYAMSSFPTFDPVKRNTIEKNKAISENYEPGSIFKTITFAAALDSDLISPEGLVDCQNGRYEIPNERPITDDHALGIVPYSDAYKYSSNIASLKIVKEKLGNPAFYQYCERFGIGARTGLGLPEEEKGIFNPLDTWKPRDALSMGFGNAVSVTLLQMAVMTSAIANGGLIVKPQIHTKITDKNGKIITDASGKPQKSERQIIRRAISEETAKTMRNMMSDVVNERGTGRLAAVDGLNIGGKTGTSRKVEQGKYLDGRYWASFTGITPIEKPVLVACVSIDDPIVGKYGGVVAGSAVAKILKNIVASPRITIGKEINLFKDTTNVQFAVEVERKFYPSFVNLDLKNARRICKEQKIDLEITGSGNVVISQTPKAGSEISGFAKIILRTDSLENEIIMPDLRGTNVADAIEMLRQRGIKTTFVDGAGKIRRQYPTVGTIWEDNLPCSLFVEKGIFDKI